MNGNTEFKEKLFSVVIACYNCENYLDETISSILNQTLNFEENIEVILVDDGSTDNTKEICEKYINEYPNNFRYFYQENKGQGPARNLGIKHTTGKYINFLDSDDKFSKNAFEEVLSFFRNHDINFVTTPLFLFDAQSGEHPLNYKFNGNKVIDLKEEWNSIILHAKASFFKREIFNKYHFATDTITSEDALMINKMLIDNPKYGIVSNAKYYYRKRDNNTSTLDKANYKKEYYFDRLNKYFKVLIDYSIAKYGEVIKFIQYLIVYDIQWLFNLDRASDVLENDEIEEVYVDIKEILNQLDDEVILSLRNDKLNITHHVLALKYSKINVDLNGVVTCEDIHSEYNGKIAQVFSSNTPIDQLDIHKIWIDICEIKENTFYLSGYLMSLFRDEDIEIEVVKSNKKIFKAKRVYYKNTRKQFLGCSLEDRYNFDFEMPITEDCSFDIYARFVGENSNSDSVWSLPIDFSYYARLSTLSNYSISRNHFLILKGRTFYISKYSYPKMIKSEIPILLRVLKRRNQYFISILFTRLIYLILYPIYRNKRIWLFMDNITSADDNAEHLYKYAITKNDEIKKYFTLDKSSKDFKRLSTIPNLIPFDSLKHRLIYLFADKIISSHPDDEILNPFINKTEQSYAGLNNADKVLLQHGVTKDNVSIWLKKFEKNLKLLATVSDAEKESFNDEGYNYDEKIVQVLGFPRFDNLTDEKPLKQIIIMPSWRKKLLYASKEQIKESEYFKHVNSLINNKNLIKIAKENKYEIIFKPHPRVYEYIELFNTNNYVKIDNEKTYQELFNTAALMITDYSSVAFDFAYMNKPLIYYQYGNDYNFEEGYFKYKTMGFGEVIETEEKLIKTVEEYIKNNCQIKEEYRNRANNFYKYKDKNNCKRLYKAVLKLG